MSNQEPQPSWWEGWPRWLQVSIITAAALLFILVWWLLPPFLYAATADDAVRVKAITDTRTALLAGLVGIGALGTFWMNSRNVKLTAKTLGLSEANFRLAELGQLTDRYTKAIEQLGDDNLDVRLGGIYALEQLLHDSRRDRATIVEVLSAFVRLHSAPVYQYKASGVTDAKQPPDRDAAIAYANQRPGPPDDVRAAVIVLGRPPEGFVPRADLRKAYLRRIELIGANLTDADLTDAIMSGANLANVDLTGATLTRAKLNRADLTDAGRTNLTDADLIDADLSGADLSDADLSGADLTRADLSNADLTGAVLNSADLGAAKGLAEEQLEGAIGDGDTVLPLEMRRPKSW